MISPWTIYWITRLDAISNFSGFVGFVVFILSLISVGLWFVAQIDESAPECAKTAFSGLSKFLVVLTLIFGPIGLLCPDSKQMASIIVLPKIINNQDVQALGADLPKLAREWIESLKPEKTAEKK